MDHKDTSVDDGYEWTAPVGSYPAGASFYGALDKAGNVLEWVEDYFVASPGWTPKGSDVSDPRGIRGGSFLDDQREARCAGRSGVFPDDWHALLGFRVVVAPGLPGP